MFLVGLTRNDTLERFPGEGNRLAVAGADAAGPGAPPCRRLDSIAMQ